MEDAYSQDTIANYQPAMSSQDAATRYNPNW